MTARFFLLVALFAGSSLAQVAAQVTWDRLVNASREPHNWLTYGGTYQSQRYTTLEQITPANVKDLELKWVFQSQLLDPFETTPLVVDGILYTVQGMMWSRLMPPPVSGSGCTGTSRPPARCPVAL